MPIYCDVKLENCSCNLSITNYHQHAKVTQTLFCDFTNLAKQNNHK